MGKKGGDVGQIEHLLLCAKALQRYGLVTQSYLKSLAIEAGCGKDRHVRNSSGFHSWLETHLSPYAARLDGSRPGEARLWVTVAESPEHMRELCLLYRL